MLVLDAATTVTVTGDTGWDFTVAGTDISHVTTLDASGVMRSGVVGSVIATAQTSADVTFLGGAGDDVFTGGTGDDTLQGGKGNDTYVIDAGSAGDALVEAADGGSDTVRSSVVSLDLNDYESIENAMLTGALDLGITGNAANNRLTGNAGDNAIDGGEGGDTVVFSGAYADYAISEVNGVVTVTDNRVGATDGTDTLTDVEYYEFSDGRRSVNPTAPTDIQLSLTTVRENALDGFVVGKLTATDAGGDTAAFSLLDDAGGRFKLVVDEIRVVFDYLLDYEQATSYDIAVRVTDLDGLTFDKIFTIELTDTNPEVIYGRETDDTIHGGAYSDRILGNGGNDILRGNGGSDTIVGGTGDDTAVFSGNFADYEIRFADVYGDAFTVVDKRSNADGTGFDGIDYVIYDDHLTDNPTRSNTASVEHLRFADITVNTADLVPYQGPTDIALTDVALFEDTAPGAVIATLTTTDPSIKRETFTYVLTDAADGRFTIVGDKLVVASGAALDFETEPAIDIGVQVTDSDGNTFTRTLTLGVRDVNEKASVSLSNTTASLAETASTEVRIKIADIVVTDDALGTNALALTGSDAAAFEIDGTTLFLRAGATLDHAVRPDLQVAVTVDDPTLPGAPDGVSATYTLAIADVPGVRMVHGTTGDDWLLGTRGNDWFVGRGGEDVYEGGRGDDTYVVDSLGDDVVENEGEGTDTVMSAVGFRLGGEIENLVLTGSAATRGIGNELNNTITGNDAANRLVGEDGDDTLDGQDGDDFLEGGRGNDWLSGGRGEDTLIGGAGNDTLDGGSGSDVIEAGLGDDDIDAGDSDDVIQGDLGDDRILAGLGDDSVDGGNGDDVIDGGRGEDSIEGGLGADTIDGGAGGDTLSGGDDDDTLFGGHGVDILYGDDGDDQLHGGNQSDELHGGQGADRLHGDNGDDVLRGDRGRDQLDGGEGNDRLFGGAGIDSLLGGAGRDRFAFERLDESGPRGSGRDLIEDFLQGDDWIDLGGLDADTRTAANDAFVLVGDRFTGRTHDAGEIRVTYRDDTTLVEADVNGDRDADFAVVLDGHHMLTQADFVL